MSPLVGCTIKLGILYLIVIFLYCVHLLSIFLSQFVLSCVSIYVDVRFLHNNFGSFWGQYLCYLVNTKRKKEVGTEPNRYGVVTMSTIYVMYGNYFTLLPCNAAAGLDTKRIRTIHGCSNAYIGLYTDTILL